MKNLDWIKVLVCSNHQSCLKAPVVLMWHFPLMSHLTVMCHHWICHHAPVLTLMTVNVPLLSVSDTADRLVMIRVDLDDAGCSYRRSQVVWVQSVMHQSCKALLLCVLVCSSELLEHDHSNKTQPCMRSPFCSAQLEHIHLLLILFAGLW